MPSPFSIFGIALLIVSVPLGIRSARKVSIYQQSQSWPKVQATIIKSFVREGSSGDGMSNLPEFAFRYSIADTEYTSSLHTEGTPFPGTEDDVREMLKRFPVGAIVQVGVKPADPSCAILDTGFPNAWNALWRTSQVAFVAGIAITLAEMVLAK